MRKYPRLVLALFLTLSLLTPLHAASRPPALDKPLPETVQDLRDIQERVKKVAAKVLPATVGIIIGHNAGSGVIVSKDGYVLTAGHVSGKPDRSATVILADGRRLNGKTLGANASVDSGMIKITEEGEWPFVEMGDASKIRTSAWCLALGHPGGWRRGRPPVLRLGRVLDRKKFLRTDCALVGGDSGGPLFDLDGKVIGIHSRISERLTFNFHVPVDTYRLTWDRLVKGEAWGGPKSSTSYIGVEFSKLARECRIVEVEKGSPAEKAGLKANDVVLRFGKEPVEDFNDLQELIADSAPGDEVSIRVRRGKREINLKVIIGKHPA